MKISCPTCNQRIEIDNGLAGTQVECPTCKQPFVVPKQQKFVSVAGQRDPREAWAARFKKICAITIVGAVALLLIVFHFEEHLPRIVVAWMWVITLYVTAFVFLLAEAFIPGPMICASISGICILIALGICFFRIGHWMSLYLFLVTVPLFFGGIYWLLDRLPLLIGVGGWSSHGSTLGHEAKVEAGESLIGSVGEVWTPLGPEGTVMVEGNKWDAVSQSGDYMPKGTQVEVLGIDKATIPRLKVRRTEREDSEQAGGDE